MTFLEAPKAKSLKVTKDRLIVSLKDGRILIVPIVWYPRLHFASIDQRKRYEILGDGEIIHWPLLDEDITIEGMLAGRKLCYTVPGLGLPLESGVIPWVPAPCEAFFHV